MQHLDCGCAVVQPFMETSLGKLATVAGFFFFPILAIAAVVGLLRLLRR